MGLISRLFSKNTENTILLAVSDKEYQERYDKLQMIDKLLPRLIVELEYYQLINPVHKGMTKFEFIKHKEKELKIEKLISEMKIGPFACYSNSNLDNIIKEYNEIIKENE